MAAKIDKDTCAGCGACVEACPAEAIKIEGDKAVVVEDSCVSCGACVDACPCSAITVEWSSRISSKGRKEGASCGASFFPAFIFQLNLLFSESSRPWKLFLLCCWQLQFSAAEHWISAVERFSVPKFPLKFPTVWRSFPILFLNFPRNLFMLRLLCFLTRDAVSVFMTTPLISSEVRSAVSPSSAITASSVSRSLLKTTETSGRPWNKSPRSSVILFSLLSIRQQSSAATAEKLWSSKLFFIPDLRETRSLLKIWGKKLSRLNPKSPFREK